MKTKEMLDIVKGILTIPFFVVFWLYLHMITINKKKLLYCGLFFSLFLFIIPISIGEKTWVLTYNDTFEDNDISEWTTDGGSWSVLSSDCMAGTYCLGEGSGDTANDHILYNSNTTFYNNESLYNYTVRFWSKQYGTLGENYAGILFYYNSSTYWLSQAVTGHQDHGRTTIWYKNGGSRQMADQDDNGAYSNTWLYGEAYAYSNGTQQVCAYTDATKGTKITCSVWQSSIGNDNGFSGFHAIRGSMYDNVEFYVWDEEGPAAHVLPDNVSISDWVYPPQTNYKDNKATVYLNWSDSVSADSWTLNYTLYVNNTIQWSGLNVSQYEWTIPSEATYSLRVDVHDNNTIVTGDTITYKQDLSAPSITFSYPNPANSTIISADYLTINITFQDDNCIYAFNVSVYNTSNNLVLDYNQSINISGYPTTYNFSHTFNLTGISSTVPNYLSVRADVTDCHSVNKIPNFNIWKDLKLNKLGFDTTKDICDLYTNNITAYDAKTMKPLNDVIKVIDYNVIRKPDKYSYNIITDAVKSIDKLYKIEHVLYNHNGLYPINTGYDNHFILGGGLGTSWFDTVSTNSRVYDFNSIKVSDNEYKIIIWSDNPNIFYESIGLLNNNSLIVDFINDRAPPPITLDNNNPTWLYNQNIGTYFYVYQTLNYQDYYNYNALNSGYDNNRYILINGTNYTTYLNNLGYVNSVNNIYRRYQLNDQAILKAGSYNITFCAWDSTPNYNCNISFITINRTSPGLSLSIDGQTGNTTGEINQTFNIIGGTGSGGVAGMLYVNGTKVNTSYLSVSNNYKFTNAGLYNITLLVNQTENYTAGTLSYFVTISPDAYFSATVKDNYDDSIVYNFSMVMQNSTSTYYYDTANGTINTLFRTDNPKVYNITIYSNYSGGYYDYYNYSFNTTGDAIFYLSKLYRLYNVSFSDYVNYNDVFNYSNNLSFNVVYTCPSIHAAGIDWYDNGVYINGEIVNCNNNTNVYNGSYRRLTEHAYNFSVRLNANYKSSQNIQYSNNYTFISDLYPPTALVNLSLNSTGFGSVSVNVTLRCIDNVMPNITYNLSYNNNLLYYGNLSNNTIQHNISDVYDGYNNVSGYCYDLFNYSFDTVSTNVYKKTLMLIDERNNSAFDVNNVSSAIIYFDDNSTKYDLQNQSSIINFTSLSAKKLRIELVYADGGIVTRWIDTSVPVSNNIRVCANRDGVTHYEQLIFSNTEKKVILHSLYSDCLVAADYTRFAYSTALILKAYTINSYYDLITYPANIETILSSIDGSVQSTINLDTLEFAADQNGINILGETLQTEKVEDSNTIKISYINSNNNNDVLNITIINMDDDTIVYTGNDFSDPDLVTILFDYTTLNVSNTTLFNIVGTQTRDGEQTTFNSYFGIDGKKGIIPAGVAFGISIFLIVFGLTMSSTKTALSWLGMVMLLITLGVLSVSVGAWYITFMMAVVLISLVYVIITMVQESSAAVI